MELNKTRCLDCGCLNRDADYCFGCGLPHIDPPRGTEEP